MTNIKLTPDGNSLNVGNFNNLSASFFFHLTNFGSWPSTSLCRTSENSCHFGSEESMSSCCCFDQGLALPTLLVVKLSCFMTMNAWLLSEYVGYERSEVYAMNGKDGSGGGGGGSRGWGGRVIWGSFDVSSWRWVKIEQIRVNLPEWHCLEMGSIWEYLGVPVYECQKWRAVLNKELDLKSMKEHRKALWSESSKS